MAQDRLGKQIQFIAELDKLKLIERQTLLLDGSRQENDAEHSWHLATMALLLVEYANEPLDISRVIRMLLVHDVVEIDAGDTYCYDPEARRDKVERELKAAERLFNLLPEDQAGELRDLWDEFEARKTPEALFANAIDRLQPLLHNCFTEGRQWQKHGVSLRQVLQRNRPIGDGASRLWAFASELVDAAVRKGQLLPD